MEIIVHGATGRMGQKLLSLMETTPGCTLAAAVTAELAKGATPLEAARTAKAVVVSSIENRQPGATPFDAVYQGAYRA